jgi:predicted nucleic acid-binding protein
VTVVSDSSPLIALARIGCFDLLPKLYSGIYISEEVYKEVVIDGKALPGTAEISRSDWIEVSRLQNNRHLAATVARTGLGNGEISAIILANKLSAHLVLMDEWKARRYAKEEGLPVVGCIGILEDLCELGHIRDLREIYKELIHQKTRVDSQTIERSLARDSGYARFDRRSVNHTPGPRRSASAPNDENRS